MGTEVMGELLRSKGFLWAASTNDVIGGWQQAGNVLRIEAETPWMCLIPDRWEGTPSEKLVLQDIRKESGEDWEYKDRRQEIVFIGHRMKSQVIQDLLDQCLLTEEEMALGPEMWKETKEEEDDEECDDEDCEDVDCEGAKEEKEEEAPQAGGSRESKKRKMENKGNNQPLKKR